MMPISISPLAVADLSDVHEYDLFRASKWIISYFSDSKEEMQKNSNEDAANSNVVLFLKEHYISKR
jgi:hypothetical protein